MTCLDENTVALYVEGRLAPAESALADAHLDRCAVCRRLCAELMRGGSDERFSPETIADRYQLLRLLGRGGMGEVHLARDTRLGRRVALKLIDEKRIGSTVAKELFLEEAQRTARFAHPNIVTLFDAGEDRGRLYLALEYLEGESLRERLAREQIGAVEGLRILAAIAGGLAEAHREGVLHRDLKPGNVLIPRDGRVRIIDFGLARDSSSAEVEQVFAGTPKYMAPEIRRGEPATESADIYSLGLIFREMSLGTATISERARYVLELCLAETPDARPSAVVVESELRAVLSQRRVERGAAPYRGLASFREQDSELFFGRDAEVLAALELLRRQGTLVIAGPSGAGKSSLVFAGIVPRLRESSDRGAAELEVIAVRPGSDPFGALAAALSIDAAQLSAAPERLSLELAARAQARGGRVLLVVDQLEELSTAVKSVLVRRSYLRALVAAGDEPESPVRVVLTVRDDFLGQLADAETRRLFAQVFVVKSPDESALIDALVEPLAAVGHRFEDSRMPKEMVAEVAGVTGALPLLELAALRLWERRDSSGVLRRSEYEAMGGVAGALAQLADGLFARTAEAERRQARTMLLRFVGPQNTRRALSAKDATEGLGAGAAALLEALVGARLLVERRADGEGEPKLELVHESLIRSWRTLAGWIAEARGERPLLEEASEAATLWERRGRPREEVWMGQALDDALRATARVPENTVSQLVREFLFAGQKRRARARDQRRGLVAVAFLACLVFALVFYRQKEAAVSAAAVALREAAEIDLLNRNYPGARAKLRDSLAAEDSLQARMLLIELQRAPLWWRLEIDTVVRALDLSPDDAQIALAAVDNSIRLVDVKTAEMSSLVGHEEQVFALAYSPAGGELAVGTQVGKVGVWDLAKRTYRERARHEGAVLDLVWEPSGKRFYTAGADGVVRVTEGESSRVLAAGPYRRLAMSPAGVLAASAGDPTIVLLDAERGEIADRYLTKGPVRALKFSGDGKWIAVGHADGSVGALDLQSREERALEAKHSGEIRRIAIDHAGRVASASEDQTVRIGAAKIDAFSEPVNGVIFLGDQRLAVSTYHLLAIYQLSSRTAEQPSAIGHARPAVSVAFSPDGKRLASSSTDRTIKLWDAANGHELGTLVGHEGPVHELSFSPDGSLLASPSNDRSVRLWKTAELTEHARLLGHTGAVWTVAFSPDGTRLASTGRDRTIRLWDVASAREHAVFETVSVASSLVYDRTGGLLASGEDDGAVRLYDANQGTLLRTFAVHRATASFVAFSQDGAWLASAGEDGTVRRVKLSDGSVEEVAVTGGRAWALDFSQDDRQLGIAASTGAWIKTFGGEQRALLGHRGEVNAIVYAPNGARLATAGDDGTVRLWDAVTAKPLWGGSVPAASETALPAAFRGAPQSPVQEIRSLPGGIAVVGFTSGHVGLWEEASGERLRLEKLHGAVTELRVDQGRVAFATELGATLEWDLSLLYADHRAALERLR